MLIRPGLHPIQSLFTSDEPDGYLRDLMQSNKSNKDHWEEVYRTKQPHEVSWTQKVPRISLELIHGLHLPKSASIIDIGGGDSTLVDSLIIEGYIDITVLDISETALQKAKKRLGTNANKVKWQQADITEFSPSRPYDLWHDRATFHFLTTPEQMDKYLHIARSCVKHHLIIGTFSENGPDKCSGLSIRKYGADQLEAQFSKGFTKLKCITTDHITPFNTRQNFLFCSFKKA